MSKFKWKIVYLENKSGSNKILVVTKNNKYIKVKIPPSTTTNGLVIEIERIINQIEEKNDRKI